MRDPAADPVPLLLGSATRPMRFTGPEHELAALAREADVEALLDACAAARQTVGVTSGG
jgi:hypothetical protein